MIITDIHAHVFPDRLADKAAHSIGDFYGTPMYSAASVDRLLAEDGEADISYSVICNSAELHRLRLDLPRHGWLRGRA